MKQIVISTLAITSTVFCLAASAPAHAARISGNQCASMVFTRVNAQNQTEWCCRNGGAIYCTFDEKNVVYKPRRHGTPVKTPAETKAQPDTTK